MASRGTSYKVYFFIKIALMVGAYLVVAFSFSVEPNSILHMHESYLFFSSGRKLSFNHVSIEKQAYYWCLLTFCNLCLFPIFLKFPLVGDPFNVFFELILYSSRWDRLGDIIILPINSFKDSLWDSISGELWLIVAKSLKAHRLARQVICVCLSFLWIHHSDSYFY